MRRPHLIELDYDAHFEPENGINTPKEFTEEIFLWARREQKDVTVLEESMEPVIRLEDQKYVCRLGKPGINRNPIAKALGFKGSSAPMGPMLGYSWVYLYKL